METLQAIWERLAEHGYKSDKGDVHSYLPVYENIFKPYRNSGGNILEIGIFKGDSLRLWSEYFSGNVYGIDCSEMPIDGLADLRPMIAEEKWNICIGDAASETDIEKFFKGIEFDIIIDDGNHNIDSQIKSFQILKNKLSKGGLYVIEDLQNIEEFNCHFLTLEGGFAAELIDRRAVNGRYDDILVVIKNYEI